jgi:hypothetical protein
MDWITFIKWNGIVYATNYGANLLVDYLRTTGELKSNPSFTEYQSTHQLFENILKILGADHTLQKQDVFARKSFVPIEEEDFLSRKYVHQFENRRYTEITTYLTITKNVRRTMFFNYDEKQYEDFNDKVEKICGLLKNRQMDPVILFEKEIKQYVKRMIAFNFRDDRYYLDNIRSSDQNISIGDTQVKSISLVDVDEINLPNAVKPFMELKDFGYPYPVDFMAFLHNVPDFETIIYNQVIVIPPQKTELSKLDAKRRRHEAIPDPSNKVAVKDIEDLLNDVQAKRAHINQRVRIRLLDDIYVDDHRFEKGNYLFGTITSLKPQRIGITISSVLVNGRITQVDLSVYDNDGLPGLYVPVSQFREFTKDLASNTVSGQNVQFSDTPENQAAMIYDMAEKAISTTTKTIDRSVGKNKAG